MLDLCDLFQEVWLALGRTAAFVWINADESKGKVALDPKRSCSKQAILAEAGRRGLRCALWLKM